MTIRRKALAVLALCAPLSLFAQERIDHLQVGMGYFNVLRDARRFQFQLEYRWQFNYHGLRPLFSWFITSKGALYVCGGGAWDIFLGKNFVLTPSFAPGLYYRGKGKDLHFPLEFRSSIELAYQTKNKGRLGVQFFHISNASLAGKNPGSESLIFFYAIPIHR